MNQLTSAAEAPTRTLSDLVAEAGRGIRGLYEDLHRHPELALNEHKTAARLAEELRARGCEVHEGIGGTGVVGLLRNGDGPTVLLRADMDGLPVAELTGLPYASSDHVLDRTGASVPVMHACGHDSHMAALVGAVDVLRERLGSWSGTIALVLQPAEESGEGAKAMIADGLGQIVGQPVVCLGQHISPLPAGVAVTKSGIYGAASDSFRVRVHGVGGHASTPETTVDPVVLASAIVLRLQGVVSRELAAHESGVVTVAAIQSGGAANVIAAFADLTINVRSFSESVRTRLLAAIRRIVDAECTASGSPKDAEFEDICNLPILRNDSEATARTLSALREADLQAVEVQAPMSGSEDFGVLGEGLGCPSVFWHWGGIDPERYSSEDMQALLQDSRLPGHLPTNHSAFFAPDAALALPSGIAMLATAAEAWAQPGK